MKSKYLMFGYALLGLIGIGVLVKFWFIGGYTLVGHDSGLAVSAGEFFKTRLFAWDVQDFGYDNSPHFGSLILHGIDYLTAIIFKTSYAGNPLNVSLWFSLVFVSSFLFAYKLRGRLGEMAPVFFPVFVTFNFYILQSVFILERAKYSILISSLIVFWYILKIIDKKTNILVSAVVTSLGLTIFNSGSWLGLPLYGGIFVLVGSAFVFEFLWSLRDRNFISLKRLTVYVLLTGLAFLLLNAYSIFPYITTFLKQDYSSLVSDSIIFLNKSWLQSISQAGSFINFFRLQGMPDWYSGQYGINTAHAYALNYLTNPILIFISLLFSILAFVSLILANEESEKRTMSFFGLVALMSMVFMAGSHEPFGRFYELLFTHLPGFAIFRSPYFKFASIFFISVSGMMAFTLSKLILNISSKLPPNRRIVASWFLSIVILTTWFIYHKPMFDSNKVFEWQSGYSTKAKIPDYITKFSYEISKIDTFGKKILLVPGLNPIWTNDSYSWGYWSLTNLPSVLVNKQFLTNNSGLNNEERSWVELVYSQIKLGNEEKFLETAERLDIGYILLRKDVASDLSSWSAQENPQLYENVISNFKKIDKVLSVGEWDLYKIEQDNSKIIDTKKNLVFVPGNNSYLSREFIGNETTVVANLAPPYTNSFIKEKLEVYKCQSCLLDIKKPVDSLPIIRILPNSRLYYFKIYKEDKTLKNAKNDKERSDAYMGFLLRRAAETMTMINNWSKEEEIAANMKVMNEYLEVLQKILISTSDGETDFETASRIVDSLGPIEINFQAFTRRDDFGKKSEGFRQQLLEVLWRIYNIKKFYSPILSNLEEWGKEKIYYFNLDKPGSHNFYIDLKSLPTNLDGQATIPSKIVFTINEESNEVLAQEDNGWLKLTLENKVPGNGKISLNFDDQPDLFVSSKESLLPLPTGEKSCISGAIKNFKPRVPYRILVQANDTDEKLKLIIKDNVKSVPVRNMFLHGENEVAIVQDSINEPFTFLYQPGVGGTDPAIFVCSSSKDVPNIKSIRVIEITSPSIIFRETFNQPLITSPEINFEKVNNTKYLIKIANAPESYILTFNQRYNLFWKLYKDGSEVSQDQHFMIDGYSNAWRVDIDGNHELTLEYSLQGLFGLGLAVTGITSIIIFTILLRHKQYLSKNK